MVRVAQKQLQRVWTRRQREFDFRLSCAVMQIVFVVWDRLVQGRQIPVDKEMKMSGVGFLRSGRRDPHSVEPEMDRGLGTNYGAVFEIEELGLRPGGDGVGPPVSAG